MQQGEKVAVTEFCKAAESGLDLYDAKNGWLMFAGVSTLAGALLGIVALIVLDASLLSIPLPARLEKSHRVAEDRGRACSGWF